MPLIGGLNSIFVGHESWLWNFFVHLLLLVAVHIKFRLKIGCILDLREILVSMKVLTRMSTRVSGSSPNIWRLLYIAWLSAWRLPKLRLPRGDVNRVCECHRIHRLVYEIVPSLLLHILLKLLEVLLLVLILHSCMIWLVCRNLVICEKVWGLRVFLLGVEIPLLVCLPKCIPAACIYLLIRGQVSCLYLLRVRIDSAGFPPPAVWLAKVLALRLESVILTLVDALVFMRRILNVWVIFLLPYVANLLLLLLR